MFVIEVIPLKRGVQTGSLSYFSGDTFEKGSIVTIPLRNQEIRGVVVDAQPVSGAKAALRAATFSLRRLPVQENVRALSPSFIATAEELAQYYACQPGTVIYQLLPPEVRDGSVPLPHTHHIVRTQSHTPEVLQGSEEERYLAYRSLVRETLAHGESLLFIVPSAIEADIACDQLGFGIEDRVIMQTSAQQPKARRSTFTALEDFSKSKLIIVTHAYAAIDRHDISTVVIEGERSTNYRERVRPYFDYRTVLTAHAKHTGRRLIFGDLLIRTEEEVQRRDEHFVTYGEAQKRVALPAKLSIIALKDKPDVVIPFKLFSPKVIAAIKETHAAKRRSFLFAARRGLAPVIACIDCGYIFRSPESGAPYSLVRTFEGGDEKRWFVCGVSGHRERAADVCTNCGGWRLRPRGIGIQHVHDELQKELPNMPIIMFDHTSANTYKKASFLLKKFYETKGAIMLGTQMALPYLHEPVTTSVVVNMDALRATPTWHQEELTLSILLRLRECTTDVVYAQTRTQYGAEGSDHVLEFARTGSIQSFYDEEITLRREFKYPPFSHFIHLTWQGSQEAVLKLEEMIKTVLGNQDLQIYSAPPNPKGPLIKYGLLRLEKDSWPNAELSSRLRTLPPQVRVVMNPDRII